MLTTGAAAFISSKYAELRGKETESKTLPVTARTLETMIRLSTALAKCRLSSSVEKTDAEVSHPAFPRAPAQTERLIMHGCDDVG